MRERFRSKKNMPAKLSPNERSYSGLTESLLKKEIGLFNFSGEQTPGRTKIFGIVIDRNSTEKMYGKNCVF